jgi:hypothetical protein
MNSAQLNQNFLVKIGSLIPDSKSIIVPTIIVEELLNTAQDIIVRKYSKLFEEGDKSKKAVSNLISTFNTTNFTTDQYSYPNGYYVNLTGIENTYKYMCEGSEEAFLSPSNSTTVSHRARVRPRAYQEYIINRDNPFKKSYEEVVIRLEHGVFDHELIIPIGFSIQRYMFQYLRTPQRIVIESNNTPEIDDIVHNELIDLAIDLYIQSIARNTAIRADNTNRNNNKE